MLLKWVSMSINILYIFASPKSWVQKLYFFFQKCPQVPVLRWNFKMGGFSVFSWHPSSLKSGFVGVDIGK